jgi:hypothetical protein
MMEGMGDEGQQWAQRLRRDPRAALKMANEMGGFRQIMFGLENAQAAGQGAASRQAMSQRVLSTFGPEVSQKFGAGQSSLADAAQTRAVTGLMPGQGGMPSEVGGQRVTQDNLASIRMAMALQSGDPKKIAEEQKRVAYGTEWSSSDIDKYRANRTKELLFLPEMTEMRERHEGLDPLKAMDVLEGLQMWQRLVDPGAVVRESDLVMMNKAGASNIDQLIAMFEKMSDKDAMPPGFGEGFLDRVDEMITIKEGLALSISDEAQSFFERNDFNEKTKNRAMPYRTQLDALRGRRESALRQMDDEAWKDIAEFSQEQFDSGELEALPDGTLFRFDGGRYVVTPEGFEEAE